jgi:hypothetical protein
MGHLGLLGVTGFIAVERPSRRPGVDRCPASRRTPLVLAKSFLSLDEPAKQAMCLDVEPSHEQAVAGQPPKW